MPVRTRLIAGNWKMNRTAMETEQFLGRFDAEMGKAELLICMPFTDLYLAEKYLAGTGIKWGAQNVYPAEKGAFTGEISPGMLKETGCSYVICGHSERRQILCESDEFVGKKVKIVLAYGMTPILCVGETLEERESGQMKTRLLEEMRAALSGLSPEELLRTVIAYDRKSGHRAGCGNCIRVYSQNNRSVFIRGSRRTDTNFVWRFRNRREYFFFP